MALEPGTILGSYEIVGPLGAGGMGEVYRANDTKLRREVAIKVLPDDFAAQPERLARFEREAHVLASLNHPNIASIYGVLESEEVRGLVLELVEGQTLAEMIADGPLPAERALQLGLQVAEAMETAHEKGIIHRDLKPANVKVTPEGTVKVLDFGLAKAFGGDDSSPDGSAEASMSPTLTVAATQAGIILGTAAYMSPEQAAGQPADRRSDIWAFGALLMEMLTGRRPFTGETVSHTLAAVLKDEPEWDRLPRDLPPRLSELLQGCLRKKARHRLQAIGDARVLLEEYFAAPDSFAAPAPAGAATAEAPRSRRLPWAVAALLAAGLGAALWAPWRGTEAPAPPRKLAIVVPGGETLFRGYGSSVAISPDGSRFALIVGANARNMHLRFLDQWESTVIAEGDGDDRPYHPFFSPDGQWVGYVTPTEMRKVQVRGGSSITISPVEFNRGASWGPDDTIVFAPSPRSGLFRVSAAGGEPSPLTELDADADESSHRWPQVLPGGEAVLFTTVRTGSDFDDASLEILRLGSGEREVIHRGGSHGRYVSSGHVIYYNDGTLFAFPFDLAGLTVTGSAVPVIEGVAGNAGQGGSQFDVSADGTLLYAVSGASAAGTPLVWVDHTGEPSPFLDDPRHYGNPSFSPDGRRLALDISDEGDRDIWIYDLERDVPTRLTFVDGDDFFPVWSPDGEEIFFASERGNGIPNIYRMPSDGTGEAELVLESGSTMLPFSISPDGEVISYTVFHTGAPEVELVDVDGGDPRPLAAGPAVEVGAHFSPDGRWLAYTSNESGEFAVYVLPAGGGRGKWQITELGDQPQWSRDGLFLYYRNDDGGLSRVAVETVGTSFRAGRSETLFEGPFLSTPDPDSRYAIAPDGDRFLMMPTREGNEEVHEHVQVVTGWFEELHRTFQLAGGGR